MVQAVSAPRLAHLVNVIVFPQKGPRPHCNEISGSDLDGDNYFCSWRPSLIPTGGMAPAMDFPATKPHELDHVSHLR